MRSDVGCSLRAWGNVVASIGLPSVPNQLLARARDFHVGLATLAACDARCAPSALFLAAWTLEVVLKSYLASKGPHPHTHDLVQLWRDAAQHGLALDPEPPQWCRDLSGLHAAPFQLRYESEFHGWRGPNTQMLVKELGGLLNAVERAITST